MYCPSIVRLLCVNSAYQQAIMVGFLYEYYKKIAPESAIFYVAYSKRFAVLTVRTVGTLELLEPLEQLAREYYIIPPIPPAGIAGTGVSSLISVMTHSVVRNIPAMLAAFSNATRVTLAGSTTPAAFKFSYTSLRAL